MELLTPQLIGQVTSALRATSSVPGFGALTRAQSIAVAHIAKENATKAAEKTIFDAVLAQTPASQWDDATVDKYLKFMHRETNFNLKDLVQGLKDHGGGEMDPFAAALAAALELVRLTRLLIVSLW